MMCDECNWEDELAELEDMVDSGTFSYGQTILKGIRDWVRENEHITNNQKGAINNVRSGATRGRWEEPD